MCKYTTCPLGCARNPTIHEASPHGWHRSQARYCCRYRLDESIQFGIDPYYKDPRRFLYLLYAHWRRLDPRKCAYGYRLCSKTRIPREIRKISPLTLELIRTDGSRSEGIPHFLPTKLWTRTNTRHSLGCSLLGG